jgi:hypothetical protein
MGSHLTGVRKRKGRKLGDGNGKRKGGRHFHDKRSFIETNPVDVVVIGHDLLNYPIPSSDPLLYTLGSVKDVSLPI